MAPAGKVLCVPPVVEDRGLPRRLSSACRAYFRTIWDKEVEGELEELAAVPT